MPKVSETQFVCDLCGRTNDLGPDEPALEEMRSHFGDIPEEERAVVCDECWGKIHPARD